MRKIGYSVGLERTVARVDDLRSRYLSDGDLTLASWKDLVTNVWSLKTDNIADVFFSLGLVRRTSGDLLVLENLDALAIATSLIGDDGRRQAALRMIVLWAILLNDGELFVNFLIAGFKDEAIKIRLLSFIDEKRARLNEALPGTENFKRINRVVNIERQEANKGSSGNGSAVNSLRRTEPLQPELRRRPDEAPTTIKFSEDYFRKIPPRRKDWAKTLGLWDDVDGTTPLGKQFLIRLGQRGFISEHGSFIFWPMDYELVRSGFRPDLLGSPKSLWDVLSDVAFSYCDIGVKAFESSDADDLVVSLERMFKSYRSLHTRKSMLRREMSVTIAFPAIVAMACAERRTIIDLPAAIEYEQTGENRRIMFRRSRNTGAALSVKR